ncbi:MAG: hypothetical protein V2A69_10580 [Pseudomonadota bacterium]
MVELLKESWLFLVILGVAGTFLYIITEIARRSEKKKEKTQSHESKKMMEEKS